MLTEARWTHVAIPSSDLDRSVEFYTALTPMVLVSTQSDGSGRSAWLSNPGQAATPFVLVIAELNAEVGKQFDLEPGKPSPTFGPFAHIGVELPRREDVDAVAARARELGNLAWEPRFVSEHVGYVCAVNDPDGNLIEFSHDQRVFSTVRGLWGGPEESEALQESEEAQDAQAAGSTASGVGATQ